MAMAMHNYASLYGSLPPAAIYSAEGKPLLSWRVAILPLMEHRQLFDEFKLDEPWDSPHNLALLPKMPQTFKHFHGRVAPEPHTTYYRVFVGPGTAFEGPIGVSFKDFPDGTSNTFLIVEAAEAVPWTKPAELDYRLECAMPAIGGHFPEGFIAAMADASTPIIRASVGEETLRAGVTRNGREKVSPLDP